MALAGPQMIGATAQATDANQWQSYSPQAASANASNLGNISSLISGAVTGGGNSVASALLSQPGAATGGGNGSSSLLGNISLASSLGSGVLGKVGGMGGALGDVNAGLSAIQGFERGGFLGDTSGLINSARLANNLGVFGATSKTLSGGLGAAGSALGLYEGIKQGGALGYTNAALSGASLAGSLSSLGVLGSGSVASSAAMLGAFAGPLAIALAPVMMGMMSPPWTENSDYASRMQSYLKAGPGQFASTGGFNGSYWDPQYTNYMAAQEDATGTDWGSLVSSGKVPFAPGVSGGGGGTKNVGHF